MAATILAVDDSASMRQMVSFTLKHAGYDGRRGCRWSRRARIRARQHGQSRAHRRQHAAHGRHHPGPGTAPADAYKFVPMLVLTTEAGQDKKMQGKQAGATGWLVKPFNPEKLLATIAKVL